MKHSTRLARSKMNPKPESLSFDPADYPFDPKETLAQIKNALGAEDSNFQTELEYAGYRDIEDYDNNVFDAKVEEEASSDKALDLSERPEGDETSELVEESLIDPQNNRQA